MKTLNYSKDIKKGLIAYLLLVSCIISSLILVYSPDSPQRLLSFAQADSLILNDLQEFNIGPDQIRTSIIQVDSGFSRKTFTVSVPPGFSNTQLHAELNSTFYPLSVETPARVFLPENRMLINLLYNGTVFRRISLRIDPELILDQNYATVLVAFEDVPAEGLLNQLISFGEPIYLALRVSGREQARDLYGRMSDRYSFLSFWLGNEGQDTGSLPLLSLLSGFNPGVPILSFRDISSASTQITDSFAQTARSEGLTFIDVSSAEILDFTLGEQIFLDGLSDFEDQMETQTHPILIVQADAEALVRLRERLGEWRRSGLILAAPPEIIF